MALDVPPQTAPSKQSSSTAPSYSVPQERIVSIEHPCLVKNLDNGLKSLGGEAQIKHVLEHKVGDGLIKIGDRYHVHDEPVVGVSLRPHDPLAKKLASTGVQTRNVLVKITLPKRTGRKRKRGSDEPFASVSEEQNAVSVKAPDLLQRMRDNEGHYSIKAVGMIPETHRFRSQPDFQMRTDDLPIMKELKDHVLRPHYDDMKEFRVDLKPGSSHITAYPLPPTLMATDQPYPYQYQQAPYVNYGFDEDGNETAWNTTALPKNHLQSLRPDAPEVPTGPLANLRLSGRNSEKVPRAIEDLKQLLEKRPVVTKRVLANDIPDYTDAVIKEAQQWVGYAFSAGPWRDTLIKFGVDPRTDPKYRVYQALMFQLDRDIFRPGKNYINLKERKKMKNNHIFDGKTVDRDVKTWQVCDIIDPMIRDLLDTDELKPVCDVYQSGWYHLGTLAKARVIMKDKFRSLLLDEPLPEREYAAIAALPDNVTDANVWQARFDQLPEGAKVRALAADYRLMAKHHASSRKTKEKQAGGGGGGKAAPRGVDVGASGEGDEDTAEVDGDNVAEDGGEAFSGGAGAELREDGEQGEYDKAEGQVDGAASAVPS